MLKLKRSRFYALCLLPVWIGHSLAAVELKLPDRAFVARAVAENRSHLMLLIAAKQGATAELRRSIVELGGEIRYQAEEVGYVHASVPTKNVLRVAALPSVEGIDIEAGSKYFLNQARVSEGQTRSSAAISLDEYLSLVTRDRQLDGFEAMGLGDLRRSDPVYDGRGVTIAVIEMHMDADAPGMTGARSADGERVPKIAGMYTFVSNETNHVDPTSFIDPDYLGVVKWSRSSVAQDGRIEWQGKSIQPPLVGEYDVGVARFSRDRVFRNADHSDGRLVEPIALRSAAHSCVWIDTDLDDDFRDEQCLKPYNNGGSGARFRDAQGNPTGARFFLSSVIQNDRVSDESIAVAIANPHSHAVAATAAGARFWGAELGGAAPGAQVLTIAATDEQHVGIEALIFAFRDRRVDIVVPMLGFMSASPIDSSHVYALISDRLVRHYGKVLIGPVSNAEHLIKTVSAQATSSETIAVGQYHSARVQSALMGVIRPEQPGGFSSAGPTDEGEIKPDVLAASLVPLPYPDYISSPDYVGKHDQTCPNVLLNDESGCFSGTSAAGPSAAGAVAVLIGAARERGYLVSPQRIREAVTATARHIAGWPANIQGRGVLNVPAALQYLEKLNWDKSAPVTVEVRAQVRTGLSGELTVAHEGSGLFEREGWVAGAKGTRVLRLKRTGGTADAAPYRVRLIGNEPGTFSIAGTVKLPLGREVALPIRIAPQTPGIHSIIVRLEDPMSGRVVRDIGATVVAAIPLTRTNGYRVELQGTMTDSTALRFYVRVPDEARLLRVSVSGAEDPKLLAVGPAARFVRHESGELGDSHAYLMSPTPMELFMPSGGVWELSVRSQASWRPGASIPIVMHVDALMDSDFKQHGTAPDSAQTNADTPTKVISIAQGKLALRRGESPHLVKINVPAGVDHLDLSVQQLGGPDGVALLGIMKCKWERCYMVEGASGFRRAGVRVMSPPSGRMVLMLDASVRQGAVEMLYDVTATTK